jgi:hypothetical protein
MLSGSLWGPILREKGTNAEKKDRGSNAGSKHDQFNDGMSDGEFPYGSNPLIYHWEEASRIRRYEVVYRI